MATAKGKTKKRSRGRPFRPGVSGNPGGRPRLLTEFRLAAREHTNKALATLVSIMGSRRASAGSRVRAVHELLDRGWGKPMQEILIEGAMATVEAPSPSWDDLTPDEKTDFGRRLIFLLARSAAHTKGEEARGS